MYDAWAIFNDQAETVLLGKQFGSYTCTFNGIIQRTNKETSIHEVLSYAMFILLILGVDLLEKR